MVCQDRWSIKTVVSQDRFQCIDWLKLSELTDRGAVPVVVDKNDFPLLTF